MKAETPELLTPHQANVWSAMGTPHLGESKKKLGLKTKSKAKRDPGSDSEDNLQSYSSRKDEVALVD